MKKQKKAKSAYTYLRDEQVEAIRKMSNQELMKEFVKENKSIRILKKKHKEDKEMADLKATVKKHRETTVPEKLQAELNDIKARLKEIKAEIDQGIEDELEEMKELRKDMKNELGFHVEKLKLIQNLIDSRES